MAGGAVGAAAIVPDATLRTLAGIRWMGRRHAEDLRRLRSGSLVGFRFGHATHQELRHNHDGNEEDEDLQQVFGWDHELDGFHDRGFLLAGDSSSMRRAPRGIHQQ